MASNVQEYDLPLCFPHTIPKAEIQTGLSLQSQRQENPWTPM